MKYMKAVVCGLAIMLLFPLTGMICCGDESETSSSVAFYPTGKEPPPLKQKDAKPARLTQSKNMKGAALVDYAIEVTIDTDESGSLSKQLIKYIPRISIIAKNKPLPKSCLLVIEYYIDETLKRTSDHSNSKGKSTKLKACVEHISLPDIGKGESVMMDANGVEFRGVLSMSTSEGSFRGKRELDGVIISLFKDDKVLIQMCTSLSLVKECTDTMPAPQAYEGSR